MVGLIRPPVVTIPGSLSTHGPVPPIGLAYIAGALRGAGCRVTVVDAAGEGFGSRARMRSAVGVLERLGLPDRDIVERLPADVDVIGVSVMFVHEWPMVRALLRRIRERFPGVPIVLGGETATSFWPWMFEQSGDFDVVIRGEAEVTVIEVVERLLSGEDLCEMDGVVARGDVVPGSVPPAGGLAPRIRRLEEVPRPAWDLFPMEKYFENPFFGVDRGRSMPVLGTRGCPYRCSFCSSPQMWTTRYLVREPADVVDEIASYVRTYGVRNINFCDLTAVTKRSWTLGFCDALDESGLEITWQLPVGTRSEVLDEEVLRRLWETGCRNVVYAPESGSERMLKVFDKRVDLDAMLRSLAAARRVGLRTHVNVIIGHPDETWPDVLSTLRFLVRAALAGCDDCAPILFCPYPGSADFDRLVHAGELVVDDAACYIGLSRSSARARSFNPRIGAGALRVTQIGLLAVFYALAFLRRPRRVVEVVMAQMSGNEDTYFDQMIRSLRRSRVSGRRRKRRNRSAQAVGTHRTS